MIYAQAFSAGAEKAFSVSTVIIPLQDEININDIVADDTVSCSDDIVAEKVTELWF